MTQAQERPTGADEPTTEVKKIWAHSGDSHAMEPEDLWTSRLPKRLADRAPRTERGEKYELIFVDGKQKSRQLNDFMDAMRPPGFKDLTIRLQDLDQEGVWAQLLHQRLQKAAARHGLNRTRYVLDTGLFQPPVARPSKEGPQAELF